MAIMGRAGRSDPRDALRRSASGAAVLTFQVADTLSRPDLRPLRTPGLGRTAAVCGVFAFDFRVADTLSRPDLRPLRTPGLGRTAARSAWSPRPPFQPELLSEAGTRQRPGRAVGSGQGHPFKWLGPAKPGRV